ncbi:hypothetical protein, partial [Cytobacillus sp. NCCP-133]|uniref:hypothetical protein n=1 Tax=Cytobacillus sp. NCCP-133 TaxID=766848 RepID=UPI002230D6D4
LIKLMVEFELDTLLTGAAGARFLWECGSKSDPAGAERRGGSRTASGKQVPGAEINGLSL